MLCPTLRPPFRIRGTSGAGAAAERHQALERLFDYYQHTATRAQARLARQTRPGPALATPGIPQAAPTIDEAGQAPAWRVRLIEGRKQSFAEGWRAVYLEIGGDFADRHGRPGPSGAPGDRVDCVDD